MYIRFNVLIAAISTLFKYQKIIIKKKKVTELQIYVQKRHDSKARLVEDDEDVI